MLIRIKQNPEHFPVFFLRAQIWVDFISQKTTEPILFFVDRSTYHQAITFFPKEQVHRLPDDPDEQIEKILTTSKHQHTTLCQFGEGPGIFLRPALMQKFDTTIHFGPPGTSITHAHFLVHGDSDASMLAYQCHAKTKLLIGPQFSFCVNNLDESIQLPSKPFAFFISEPPKMEVTETLEAAFRELQISMVTPQTSDYKSWPAVSADTWVLTDAGPHVQELASYVQKLIVFAGNRRQLRLCYAIETTGLAQSLGWVPSLGRTGLAEKLNQIRALKPSSLKATHRPNFFDKLSKIIQESTP